MAAPKAQPLIGHAKPRIAPPTPARSDVAGFRETALSMGITLMPWQETAARYLTATGRDGLLLYREVCIVVARQNGKTTLAKPHIIRALRSGKRILHIAQNRNLPREMFDVVADALATDESLFPKRRGRTIWPRYGAGQEEIKLRNGGTYRIAAANRGGARGWPTDVLIIDELREMETNDVIGAAEPGLTMSTDPQLVYLSNAGTDQSVVLNDVRDRAGKDASLAYLEWSADKSRDVDDRIGWAESNPALGHYPQIERTLETSLRKHMLAGTIAVYETEHLCRWVETMRLPFARSGDWATCEAKTNSEPDKPVMAVSMDPGGSRAAAGLAWTRDDGFIGFRLIADVTGNPINGDRLARDLVEVAASLDVSVVGFDPLTDAVLAKHFPNTEPISGMKYANASAQFATLVESRRIAWDHAASVGDDLAWTARKFHEESGSFQAVRMEDGRPIPAALAAIRAVWLLGTPEQPSRYEDRGMVAV